MVTVTIPDCAIGNIIFQKVFVGGHPSIAAASSYVLDKFAKKVKRKIVVYGMLIPIYRKINVTLLANKSFKIPIFATRQNNGSTIMVIGTPMADTKLVWMILFPRNVYLASTYAAGAQIKISAIQEITEYTREFIKKVATPPDPQAAI